MTQDNISRLPPVERTHARTLVWTRTVDGGGHCLLTDRRRGRRAPLSLAGSSARDMYNGLRRASRRERHQ